MTDKEIIKALENCLSSSLCTECPYHEINCCSIERDCLNLINRQQAEIERLEDKVKRLQESIRLMLNYDDGDERIKAEAIKEFAERLKECCRKRQYVITERTNFGVINKQYLQVVDESDIDTVEKEMTGEQSNG